MKERQPHYELLESFSNFSDTGEDWSEWIDALAEAADWDGQMERIKKSNKHNTELRIS